MIELGGAGGGLAKGAADLADFSKQDARRLAERLERAAGQGPGEGQASKGGDCDGSHGAMNPLCP